MRAAPMPSRDHVAGRLGAARGGDAGEIRHRSAAYQQSYAIRRVAQHFLEPADAQQLHFGGGRPGAPAGHIDVQGGGDHAAHRRHGQARGRDVAEESRVPVVAAEFHHDVADGGQEVCVRQAGGRCGLVEDAAQAGGGGGTHDGTRGQGVVIVGYQIECGAPHFADLGDGRVVLQSVSVAGIAGFERAVQRASGRRNDRLET